MGKKGPFFPLNICSFGKRVHRNIEKVSICRNKGSLLSVLSPQESFPPCKSQHFVEKGSLIQPTNISVFEKKKVIFPMEKSVERGSFLNFRMIIRPPFMFQWRDRDLDVFAFEICDF